MTPFNTGATALANIRPKKAAPSLCLLVLFLLVTFSSLFNFFAEMKVLVSYPWHGHLFLKFFVPIFSYLTVNCVFPNLTYFGLANILIIFVTQTKTGTMVKHVPQEQMVGVRSYPSRELFSPLFRVCHVSVV